MLTALTSGVLTSPDHRAPSVAHPPAVQRPSGETEPRDVLEDAVRCDQRGVDMGRSGGDPQIVAVRPIGKRMADQAACRA